MSEGAQCWQLKRRECLYSPQTHFAQSMHVQLPANFKLDQPASWGFVGHARVPMIRAGMPDRQKGHAGSWGSANMRVLVNLEVVPCVLY